MRILLIEDDPICALMATQYFESAGVEVEHYLTAKEGIDQFLDSEFDAVVTDIDLPDIQGDQLADMMSITHIDTPIFGLTANKDFCNDHRSMQQFYAKPINNKIVNQIIKIIN